MITLDRHKHPAHVPRLPFPTTYPRGSSSSNSSSSGGGGVFKSSDPSRTISFYVDTSTPEYWQVTCSIKGNGGTIAPTAQEADIIIGVQAGLGPNFTEFCHPAWLGTDLKDRVIRRIRAGKHTPHWTSKVLVSWRWVDACMSKGQFLGEESMWGNYRLGFPPVCNQLFNVWALPPGARDPPIMDPRCHDCGATFKSPWSLEYHLSDSVPCWIPEDERPEILPLHGVPVHRLLPGCRIAMESVRAKPREERQSAMEVDGIDGEPMADSIDGEPMTDGIDGEPIADDIDGEPMEEEEQDELDEDDHVVGEPMLAPAHVLLANWNQQHHHSSVLDLRPIDIDIDVAVDTDATDRYHNPDPETVDVAPDGSSEANIDEDLLGGGHMSSPEIPLRGLRQPQDQDPLSSPEVPLRVLRAETFRSQVPQAAEPDSSPEIPLSTLRRRGSSPDVPLSVLRAARRKDSAQSTEAARSAQPNLTSTALELEVEPQPQRILDPVQAATTVAREPAVSGLVSEPVSEPVPELPRYLSRATIWLDPQMHYSVRSRLSHQIDAAGAKVTDNMDRSTHIVINQYSHRLWGPVVKEMHSKGRWCVTTVWLERCFATKSHKAEALYTCPNGNLDVPYSKENAKRMSAQPTSEDAAFWDVMGARLPIATASAGPSTATAAPPAPSAAPPAPKAAPNAAPSTTRPPTSASNSASTPAFTSVSTSRDKSTSLSGPPSRSAATSSSTSVSIANPKALEMPTMLQKLRFGAHLKNHKWELSEMAAIFRYEYPILWTYLDGGDQRNGQMATYLQSKYGGGVKPKWIKRLTAWEQCGPRFYDVRPKAVARQVMVKNMPDFRILPTCLYVRLFEAVHPRGGDIDATAKALAEEYTVIARAEWHDLLDAWVDGRGQFAPPATPAAAATSAPPSQPPARTRAVATTAAPASAPNAAATRIRTKKGARCDAGVLAARFLELYPTVKHLSRIDIGCRLYEQDPLYTPGTWTIYWKNWLRRQDRFYRVQYNLPAEVEARNAAGPPSPSTDSDGSAGSPPPALSVLAASTKRSATDTPDAPPAKRPVLAAAPAPAPASASATRTGGGFAPLTEREAWAMALYMHATLGKKTDWFAFHKANPHRSAVQWMCLAAEDSKGSAIYWLKKIGAENWWPSPASQWPTRGQAQVPIAVGPFEGMRRTPPGSIDWGSGSASAPASSTAPAPTAAAAPSQPDVFTVDPVSGALGTPAFPPLTGNPYPLTQYEAWAMALHMYMADVEEGKPDWHAFYKANPHRPAAEWRSLCARDDTDKRNAGYWLAKLRKGKWWPGPPALWPTRYEVRDPVSIAPFDRGIRLSLALGSSSGSTAAAPVGKASVPSLASLPSLTSMPSLAAASAATPSISVGLRVDPVTGGLVNRNAAAPLTEEEKSNMIDYVKERLPNATSEPEHWHFFALRHPHRSRMQWSSLCTTEMTRAASTGPQLTEEEKELMIAYINNRRPEDTHQFWDWEAFATSHPHRSSREWLLCAKDVRKAAKALRQADASTAGSSQAQAIPLLSSGPSTSRTPATPRADGLSPLTEEEKTNMIAFINERHPRVTHLPCHWDDFAERHPRRSSLEWWSICDISLHNAATALRKHTEGPAPPKPLDEKETANMIAYINERFPNKSTRSKHWKLFAARHKQRSCKEWAALCTDEIRQAAEALRGQAEKGPSAAQNEEDRVRSTEQKRNEKRAEQHAKAVKQNLERQRQSEIARTAKVVRQRKKTNAKAKAKAKAKQAKAKQAKAKETAKGKGKDKDKVKAAIAGPSTSASAPPNSEAKPTAAQLSVGLKRKSTSARARGTAANPIVLD